MLIAVAMGWEQGKLSFGGAGNSDLELPKFTSVLKQKIKASANPQPKFCVKSCCSRVSDRLALLTTGDFGRKKPLDFSSGFFRARYS
jgi:hypothetical protein